MLPISVRIIAHQKEEWGLPCRITGPIVVRELRHQQPACPIILFVVSNEPQECLDPLVRVFRLTVGSGMVCCGYVLLYAHHLAQLSREFRCESRILIADDFAG